MTSSAFQRLSFSDANDAPRLERIPARGQVIDMGPARGSPEAAAEHPRKVRIRFPRSLRARFRPMGLLGAGGFGAVFLAEDRTLERKVAVKVMLDCTDRTRCQRFLREAAGLARLKHPSLPTIYSYGETEDGPYIALEYLQGVPLHEAPREVSPLGPMLQVAEALEEIHRHGFVHRDVKPANIVLTESGRAVLVDFGLAYHGDHTPLTKTGKIVGTLHYMAPEVLAYQRPGPEADWFAWGVSLYALLERSHPFHVPALASAARKGRKLRPEFSAIDPASTLARLLRRALSLTPSRRPKSRREIEALLDGTDARSESGITVPSRALRSRRPARPAGAASSRAPGLLEQALEPARDLLEATLGALGRLLG